ncbi:MAG: hypothetical protein QOH61_2789 [Chloroflexota bacterium]|jgi:hypothetical protein|nr:hypothetical protein [Chloroflexota bacterium]
MSNTLPQTHPSVGQLHWRGMTAIAALLLVAAALSVYLIASRDDGQSASPAVHSITSSGPNETARGHAAASASGAEPVLRSGGPDETARGQAVASASSSGTAPAGGPDETARGIAASQASR